MRDYSTGDDQLIRVRLVWPMTLAEINYWQTEADRLGTTWDHVAHMLALAGLSARWRMRSHRPDVCDALDQQVEAWARALGLAVVERDADVPESRMTFEPVADPPQETP